MKRILLSLTAFALPCAALAQQPGAIKPVNHAEPAQPNIPTTLRAFHVSAHSGVEWLVRGHNDVTGRFIPGWLPAIGAQVDENNYLHQCAATATLARAARYYGDERYLMKARQAMLSLLAETQLEPDDASCRVTTLPGIMVNRIAAAGALLVAIHELKDPAEDLLKQGDELANFLRKQQQADGSFAGADGVQAGYAIRGLMRSIQHRPTPWKLEVVAKALPGCRKQWQAEPNLALMASLVPGLSEAFIRTKDQVYADLVYELCDWACAAQYSGDTTQPKWIGGFKTLEAGKPGLRAPDVSCAATVEALALGCLVTRHAKNDERYYRYRSAAELGSQFLVSLQYTDRNTLHFDQGYRATLLGGYHASLTDGNLRLDYNACCCSALVMRLTCVGDR
jgi:hypothetical protein